MRVEITCRNNIQFKISEAVNEKIRKWRLAIDEEAYDYQIRTGFLAKGNKAPINRRLLDRMKQEAKKEGSIKRPYEGASGGGASYNFSITENGPVLKAYNYLTRRSLNIKNTPAAGKHKEKQKMRIMFKITGDELEKLKKWQQTEKGHGDLCDYIFCFGPTSIGDSVKVRNRKTKTVIDLTDYASW